MKNASDVLSAIMPATRDVRVGDQTLTVRGVPIRHVAALLSKYPVLLAYFSGTSVDMMEILTAAPDAAIAIMAAGIDNAGDASIEAALDNLSMGVQLDLLTAIIELTTTGDSFIPFVAFLRERKRASTPTESPSQTPPEVTSDSNSPPESNSSSPTDMTTNP